MVEEKIETFLTQLKSLDALSLSLIEEIRALKEKNQTLEDEIASFKEQSVSTVSAEELQKLEEERDALKADNAQLAKAVEELSKVAPQNSMNKPKKAASKKVDDSAPTLF